jgi:hypothetical protein
VDKVRGVVFLGPLSLREAFLVHREKEWLLAVTATKNVPLYAELYHLIKQTVEKVSGVVFLGPLSL